MNKISLFIRRMTVPPVFAVILLGCVYCFRPDYFGGPVRLITGIFFLAVLPVAAYPLQKYIPYFKDKGRNGQRTLAMIFSFVGYLLGTVTAYVFSVPTELKIIYIEYLFCGIGVLIFNKLIKLKVSGHACGIVGPAMMLSYLKLYIPSLIAALLIIPVFVSSIKTKRHTVLQLVLGGAIPFIMLCVVHTVIY